MFNTHVVSEIRDVSKRWNSIWTEDIFLSWSYLEALSNALPNNIQQRFICITKNENLIGFVLVQHVKIYFLDTFRENKSNFFYKTIGKLISYFLKGDILIVGNLTQTGQHGIYFDKSEIDKESFVNLIFNSLDGISAEIKKETGKTIKIYLLKDYFIEDPLFGSDEDLEKRNLYRERVQPNMILALNPHWKTLDDYSSTLNKKYKRRYRSAIKKLGNILYKELELDEIEINSEKIHRLYRNVSRTAKFNTFLLPDNHFYEFKKHLKQKFRIFGYFLNDELIAFHSLILNGENLETYFLGYDHTHQTEKQLYLNMLYNILEFGIMHNFKNVVYARTAMEIKSSVGAQPISMELYIKHTNPIINKFVAPIFKLLDPDEACIPRHPFD